MESAINKKNVIKAMRDEAGEHGVSASAGILLAMIELREAVEEGFNSLVQSRGEAIAVLIDGKECLDTFLQRRLESEEVLGKMAKELDEVVKTLGSGFDSGKIPEYDDKPESPSPEEKKSDGVLNEEKFGPIPFGSGKT